MLSRAVNSNQIMKYRVESTNTILLPYPLKPFRGVVPLHIFRKLFQPDTDHGFPGQFFQMRYISKRYHYWKCGQLGTIQHILNECPRAACWYFTERQPLVSIYQMLCIADFSQHMKLFIQYLGPSIAPTFNTLLHSNLASLIKRTVLKFMSS